MGLVDQIQKDVQQITSDLGGFATSLIFFVTNGQTVVTATCNGIAVNHNLAVNEYGIDINSKTARVTVSELALRALSYPLRDSNNRVSLKEHRVTWTDISGIQATYIIREQFPNGQTGLIRCTLGEFAVATPPGRTIISWMVCPIHLTVVETPNPAITQQLDNGDIIPAEYALNDNGTLTIPYMIGYTALTPFILEQEPVDNFPYNRATGTFGSLTPSFNIGNKVSFNASLPVWMQ